MLHAQGWRVCSCFFPGSSGRRRFKNWAGPVPEKASQNVNTQRGGKQSQDLEQKPEPLKDLNWNAVAPKNYSKLQLLSNVQLEAPDARLNLSGPKAALIIENVANLASSMITKELRAAGCAVHLCDTRHLCLPGPLLATAVAGNPEQKQKPKWSPPFGSFPK